MVFPALPCVASSPRGNTALHFAAATGDTALVQQLISAGAKVGAADRNGRGLSGRGSGLALDPLKGLRESKRHLQRAWWLPLGPR